LGSSVDLVIGGPPGTERARLVGGVVATQRSRPAVVPADWVK